MAKKINADIEYKFKRAFRFLPNCVFPIIGEKYRSENSWKRLIFFDWGCEWENNCPVNVSDYYKGVIKEKDLKIKY